MADGAILREGGFDSRRGYDLGFDPLLSCEEWLETTMSTRMEEGNKVKLTDCTAHARERPISGNSNSCQRVMLHGEHRHIGKILVRPHDPPPSEGGH